MSAQDKLDLKKAQNDIVELQAIAEAQAKRIDALERGGAAAPAVPPRPNAPAFARGSGPLAAANPAPAAAPESKFTPDPDR